MAKQKKISSGIIGILDLQGGVYEHLDHLQRLSVIGRKVKHSSDFNDLAGLIIPGGESSCISRLLSIFEIKKPILSAYQSGMKIWGTCAGAILLAKKVEGESSCLGLIDIEIKRNGFGSQLDSFKTKALIPSVARVPIPLTFIRAPKIVKAGEEVKVLLKIDDYIAAAETEGVLVTTFHPELTGSLAFHHYFAAKCGIKCEIKNRRLIDTEWRNCSWTQMARNA